MKYLLLILLFLFSCEKNSSSPLCCLDSCDELGNVEDCAGECGGDAVVDECGICDGPGIADNACDCDGNVLDCVGECGGSIIWCFDDDGILDTYNLYLNNGSITSAIFKDGVNLGSVGDVLAAFVDNELRGVAIATEVPFGPYQGDYQFLTLIYSNVSTGNINFKFYDYESNNIYNIVESYQFISDMIEGNVKSPVLLEIDN